MHPGNESGDQLDMLQYLRQQARRELLAESRKHPITPSCRKFRFWGRFDRRCLLAKGMKPMMARVTLARKIAAITLTLWKKEETT